MVTLVLLVLTLRDPQAQPDPGATHARQTAYARVALALKLAADKELVQAVSRKNASGESPADIARKDREWMASPSYPLRKELTQGACADRLRSSTAGDSIVGEVLLMDAHGALVCASVETSDYNQGDETKWKKPYEEGNAVFVDEPAQDANTGLYAVQLSVPVSEAGKRIGALTLTLKVPKPAPRD